MRVLWEIISSIVLLNMITLNCLHSCIMFIKPCPSPFCITFCCVFVQSERNLVSEMKRGYGCGKAVKFILSEYEFTKKSKNPFWYFAKN